MTMDQPASGKQQKTHTNKFNQFSGFGDYVSYSSDPFTTTSPSIGNDPDVDWSVFENAGMKPLSLFQIHHSSVVFLFF